MGGGGGCDVRDKICRKINWGFFGGWWGVKGEMGVGLFLLEDVQDGVENLIGSYRVLVIEVIVGGGFFVDVEPF